MTIIAIIVTGLALIILGIVIGMNFANEIRHFLTKLRRLAIKVGLFGGGTAAVIGLVTFVAEYILK